FFFLNYEAYRDVEQVSSERIVPTAALRDGVVQYACDASAYCPGNTATGYSGATYSPGAGYYAVSPAQLTAMDANAAATQPGLITNYTPGPNAAMLAYFNRYPVPNDFSQGDGLNTAGYRFASPTN